jgi:hypothetical protein
MAVRDAVKVNDHLGRHDQDDVPVGDRDGQIEGRLADDGAGEIEDHVAVPVLHLEPPRYHPAPVALDNAVADLQLDQFFGFRDRRRNRNRAGRGRQVGQQGLKLSVGPRRQRGPQPLVEFIGGEPPVARRDA